MTVGKYIRTKEIREKISNSSKGRVAWNRGIKMSDEIKKKISIAKIGCRSPRKGVKLSEETKKKLSVSHLGQVAWNKGKLNPKISGSKHPGWKGGITSNKTYVVWLKNKRNRLKRILNENGSLHCYEEWLELKKKYEFTCPCCKLKEPEIKLTEDHIIPLSKGGSDLIQNIQPLCMPCNSRKHTNIFKY